MASEFYDEVEFERWLSEPDRPEAVRKLARMYPPVCYRSTTDRGHYRIIAYAEDNTVRLVHGRDSYLPGFSVFGYKPADLVKCECGEWDMPTPSQQKFSRRRVKAWIDRKKKES